jgi:hypothetical protein
MTINSNTQSFTFSSNSLKSNETKDIVTAKNSIEEPDIKARNEYKSEHNIQIKQMLTEYYSKAVEIDRTFKYPREHILDKYKNSDSSYFRSDLTENERQIAYYNESAFLSKGEGVGFWSQDPVILQTIGYINGDVQNAVKKAYQREKVNEQFGQLLKNNNITIPENTKLSFTIDPYSYKVDVNGTDDTHLSTLIEKLLDEDNAEQLFFHINSSKSYNNTQFTDEKREKYSLYHTIENETGYKLDELEIVNDKFITEDGKDIFDIYTQIVKDGTSVPEEFKSFVIDDTYNKLNELAKKGFDSVPDLILSIDYENGSFYDVGQSDNYGTGLTKWIDKLQLNKQQVDIYV